MGVERLRDVDRVDADAETVADLHGVFDALRAGVRRRHRQSPDAPRTERVRGEHGDQRGVDPAREPEHRVAEPVLVDVVAEAQDDRAVDLGGLALPVGSGVRREGVAVDVDHEEVLIEAERPACHRAVRRHDERPAVEHELVLPADGVHVDQPCTRLGDASAQHVFPFVRLAPVVRRTVDVDDRRDPSVPGPGGAGQPGVLADGEPDLVAAHRDQGRRVPRLEVALLIEHAVVRQLALAVAGVHGAAAQERGGVVQPVFAAVDEAHHHVAGPRGLARERVEGRQVVVARRSVAGPDPRADSR